MPLYLSKFSYTPETWARLIHTPEDRRRAAQSYIESVGGKLHGFWYAFGAHDPLGGPRQRVDGCGCAGDYRRLSPYFLQHHSALDRRRSHGCYDQGRARPVSTPRRLGQRSNQYGSRKSNALAKE